MLPSSKNARLSADALAKSLNITPLKSREHMASAFGCGSWMVLVDKCQRAQPFSDVDIKELSETFLSNYCEAAGVSITGSTFTELARLASPYSKKPKVFRVDEKVDSRGGINVKELFDASGFGDMSMADMLENMIDQMGDSIPEDERKAFKEAMSQHSSAEIEGSIRLMQPSYPCSSGLFLLSQLNWDVEFIADDLNEPQGDLSMLAIGGLPVFGYSAIVVPGDGGDADFLNNMILRSVEGLVDIGEDHIVLLGSGAFKEIGDDTFSVIGLRYSSEHKAYFWLFLSELTPDEQLAKFSSLTLVDDLDNTMESPPLPTLLSVPLIEFPDATVPAHIVYSDYSQGCEINGDEFKVTRGSRMVADGVSGWSSFVSSRMPF